MSAAVSHALEHATNLIARARPVDTQATTEQYETQAEVGDATLTSPVPGAPTLPVGGGPTDIEAGREPHASKITAAVEVLIVAVQRLNTEFASAQARALTDPRVTLIASEVADLRDRHDRLRDVVQTYGGRIDALDEVALEVPHLRIAVRLVLVGVGALVPLVLLVLAGVASLVLR